MLDSFFNLGVNRRIGWQVSLILFTCVAFADFTSSDSAVLSSISLDVADIKGDVSDASVYLSNIESDTVQIIHLQESSFNRLGNVHSSVDSAVSFLGQVTNILKDINAKLTVQTISHNDQNDSFNTLLVHDPRADDIYHIGEDVYNAEIDIYNRLGALNDSINNLTNYFSYSPLSSSIYTNFPALFVYSEDSKIQAKYALWRLTGVEPTDAEVDYFWGLIHENGLSNWFYFALSFQYSFDDLPHDFPGVSDLPYPTHFPYPFDDDVVDTFTHAHYYQYGTREFTDTSIGISNIVVEINQNLSLLYSNTFDSVQGNYSGAVALNDSLRQPVTYDGDTGEVKHSGGIMSAVGDLAQDCIETLPMVSTNLVEANTNEIVNLEDNGYNTAINDIKNATPDSTPGEFDTIVQDLNAEEFTGTLVSVLGESTEPCVFSFDLSGFNLVSTPSRNRDIPQGLVNFTLTDVKETTNSYVYFFCSFMECILCLFFGAMLWNLIFESTVHIYK